MIRDIAHRARMLFQSDRNSGVRIAVHLHLFYMDLADEFIGYLKNIHRPFDLYVTVASQPETARQIFSGHFTRVEVMQVENRGKDMGGFLAAIGKYDLENYDLVLKIHSKKSLNQESYFASIKSLFGADVTSGDIWRKQLLDPILGDHRRVERVLTTFRKKSDIGIIGSRKFICTAPDINEALFKEVCRRANVEEKPYFIAGSMFWIRGSLLQGIKNAGFTINDFKFENNTIEGGMEHCLERIFGPLAESRKMKMIGIR